MGNYDKKTYEFKENDGIYVLVIFSEELEKVHSEILGPGIARYQLVVLGSGATSLSGSFINSHRLFQTVQ